MRIDWRLLSRKEQLLIAAVGAFVVLFVGAIVLLHALFSTSHETEVLKDRAMSEVQMRMELTPDLQAVSIARSASFYATEGGCWSPIYKLHWPHRMQVDEFIDVTEPTASRIDLQFCVNTDTWKIAPMNDLAYRYTGDETAYLKAQEYCFKLTDANNKARLKLIESTHGQTFLRVRPSDEDTSTHDFHCTSTFDLKDAPQAVWMLYPNPFPGTERFNNVFGTWDISDNPWTTTSKEIEKELDRRKVTRCKEALSRLGEDKSKYVRTVLQKPTDDFVYQAKGADEDDPNLLCRFFFYEETTNERGQTMRFPFVGWKMMPNSRELEMVPLGDDAKKVDEAERLSTQH